MSESPNEMRNQQAVDILDLAIELQTTLVGLTTQDICRIYGISRRTAERRREAVAALFGRGSLEKVDSNDIQTHWRLRSRTLWRLIQLSDDEVSQLVNAATALKAQHRDEITEPLLSLAKKLTAIRNANSDTNTQQDFEVLLRIEGVATRPGPREHLNLNHLRSIREAIARHQVISFEYYSRSSNKTSVRRVCPYGMLYGSAPYLVGPMYAEKTIRIWRLSRISDLEITIEHFEIDPTFDLHEFSNRSFGVYQEKPFNVILSFPEFIASEIEAWTFHPNQTISYRKDGTVEVRFKAGGAEEMLWHFFTWGNLLTIEKPNWLRERMSTLCIHLAEHHL